jgi:hypothetical protein
MLAIGIPMLILFIVSNIGLFLFWRPARTLYVITIIVGLLETPFFGPYVDAGFGTMFEDAAIIVSGVVLALIYFSPLKDLYNKPRCGSGEVNTGGCGKADCRFLTAKSRAWRTGHPAAIIAGFIFL